MNRFVTYKIIIIDRVDDSYYKCNTSGLMEPEIKLIFETNKAYYLKRKIKFRIVQRRYDINGVIPANAKPKGQKLAFEYPLSKAPCTTCPFREIKGKMQNVELANAVLTRNLFKSQQICHHPRTQGKQESHRCRGYFDYAEKIYERIGIDTKKVFLNTNK